MNVARGLAGLAVVAATVGACGRPAASSLDPVMVDRLTLCDKRCACESCRTDERALCKRDAKNDPALARASHCDAQLEAWARCERESAACLDGRWLVEGCDKQHAALLACTGR